MAASEDEVRLRVLNAQERLNTELKRWLDPQSDDGKCVIAKACMALRNNDGGFVIIGLHDDGRPDDENVPATVRDLFAQDRIQEIVSRFASERFEIYVHFVEHDGVDRVVIEIQGGVRTPVVCRSELRPPGGSAGLRADTVYVRTLESNGRVSTAPMRHGDWSRLLDTCFTNREADIASFIRRHLPELAVHRNVSSLADAILASQQPTTADVARQLLDVGYARYEARRAHHMPPPPDIGTREVAVVIDGTFRPPDLTREFIEHLDRTIPEYSGWRPWGAVNIALGAAYIDNGWEALVYDTTPPSVLQFSRIESAGRFYNLESLSDVVRTDPETERILDYHWEIGRVAQTILVALALSNAVCGADGANAAAIEMRWRHLAGRRLDSRQAFSRLALTSERAQQAEQNASVSIPLATARNAIAPFVEALVKPLFLVFGGYAIERRTIEAIVDRVLTGYHP